MKYIGYKNPHPDSQVTFDLILIGVNENQTPEEVLSSVDSSYNARIFDDSDFPGNLNELPFWNYDGEEITYDLEKFRELIRNRLRAHREVLFKKLDIDFMKALEVSADFSAIVAEKERLRNITNVVDTPTTIDELKAISIETIVRGY